VIYFVGGLASLVPAELYSIVLNKVARHGFFVFGVDYDFPLAAGAREGVTDLGQDIGVYFRELEFVRL